jgi:hypothetical protein
MSQVAVPAPFDWIGSAERGGTLAPSVTAAFRTDLTAAMALDAAIDGLTSSGWERRDRPSFGGAVFGGPALPRSETACRGDDPVTVTASEMNGVTYVSYGFSLSRNNTACDQDPRAIFGSSSADRYMPNLQFPPDPVTGQAVRPRGSGGGGGGNERYSQTEIEHNATLGDLASYLSQQLAAQGWISDASWTGSTTAGSTWSRQPDADTELEGTLEIITLAATRYDVSFHVVTRN